MQEYAEEEEILTRPRPMIFFSFEVTDGTIKTPLLLFHLEVGFVLTKVYHLVDFAPVKCFENFVQHAVNARFLGYENPNSGVVAESMNLLARSSYGFQLMDRSCFSVTMYMNHEKTHAAISKKIIKIRAYQRSSLRGRAGQI